MYEEEEQVLDTLDEGEGDTTTGEGINDDVSAELAKARELADNYKTRAEKAEAKLKGVKTQTVDPDEIRKQTTEAVRAELEAQYLEDSDFPDDIKDAIKNVAKMNNISVKQAEKDPYIAYKIEQAVRDNRINEASIRSGRKAVPEESKSTFLDPSKFDLNTEEGRKAWKDAKAKRAQ
jgi:hypothetical protein